MNPRDLDMDTRVHHRKPKLYLPYFQIQRALEIKNLSNRLLSQRYIPELMTSGQLFPQVEMIQMNLQNKGTHRIRECTYDCQLRKGTVKDFGKVRYTSLYLKWITNKNLLYSTWNCSMLCARLDGRTGGGLEENGYM